MDPASQKPELEDGQTQHQDHQDDRLCRRATQIVATEAIHIDLVNKRHWIVSRLALHHRVNDAKGVEKRVGDVYDQQEKACRGQQWECYIPETARRRAIIN